MPNEFAIGSALVIPDKLIENLKAVDKHIENIQKHATGAATNVGKLSDAFGKLNAQKLDVTASNLEKIVQQIQALSGASVNSSLSSSLSAANTEARNLAGSITRASENVDKLNSKKVTVTYDNAMSSAESASSIKQRAEAIRQLTQVRENLSTKDADYATKLQALNNKIEELNRLNREAVMTEKEKAASEDKSIRAAASHTRALASQQSAQAAAVSATARYINANTRLANAQERAARSVARNVTDPQEALRQANLAKSIEQRILAIKSLESARNKLASDDANYKSTLDQLNAKIKDLNQTNKEAIAGSKALGEQYNSLGAIAERMGKRLLVYFSLDAMKEFGRKIIEVRGNFELQQRSLEAIIQNQTKANEIFNKTIQLAVKSPFKIQELITYTKQLAAYRIESDKLYDTTKRLADVSAGLGVDMQRLILAYGQVKAAAYLRGTEVRQFTEAGVNMYGELQKYFEEVKGEAYTTAQIVDMISKRMVTFEDIEAIFKRLTDSGGLFYNMQEIQAETLQGRLSNLADSMDIMYNKIGKDHEGFLKGLVEFGRVLANNYETVTRIASDLLHILALLWLQSKRLGISFRAMFTTNTIGVANKLTFSFERMMAAILNVGRAIKTFAVNLKAAFMNNIISIAIIGIAEALYSLYSWYSSYNEKMEEVIKNENEEYNSINALIKKYNDLAIARKNSADPDIIKNQRAVLKEIVAQIGDMGVDEKAILSALNIGNIDYISEEQLNSTKSKLQKYANSVISAVGQMSRAMADHSEDIEGWFNIFGDNIATDAQQLADSESEAISKMSKMEAILNMVGASYNSLTDKSKEYYKSIKDGQKVDEGEGQIQYLERLRVAYKNIISQESKFGSDMGKRNAKLFQKTLSNVGFDWSSLRAKEGEFMQELVKLKEDVEETDPIKLKAAIDKVAVDNSWTENQKILAYKVFKVPLAFDQDKVKKDIDWVDEYLKDFFAKKKYTVNVKMATDNKDALDDFVNEGDNAAKTAKRYDELIKRFKKVKENSSKIDVDDKIRAIFKNNQLDGKISVQEVLDQLEKLKKVATETAQALGVDPFEKVNNKIKKQQQDILQEQIDTLKKLQSRYEELYKFVSKNDAAEKALNDYAEALAHIGIKLENGFIPDKENVINKIEELANKVTDRVKRSNALQVVADMRVKLDTDNFKISLEDAKKDFKNMISSLDLHTKLTDLGLGEGEIEKMFGNLPNSLKNVKAKVIELFQAASGKMRGDDGKGWGKEWEKAYQDALDEISKKQSENNLKQFEELTKAYKKQMEGQLAIDAWYAEQRKAILENSQLASNPALKESYLRSLDNLYKQKSDKNIWSEFKDSPYYTDLFDNIEQQSSRMLNSMLDKLKSLRTSLKDLDPSELKEIVSQENKLESALNKKNPFKSLSSNLKNYIKFLKERKTLEDKLKASNKQVDNLTAQSNAYGKSAQEALDKYNAIVEAKGADNAEAKKSWNLYQRILRAQNMLLSALKKEKDSRDGINNKISNGLKLGKAIKEASSTITEYFSAGVSSAQMLTEKLGLANNEFGKMSASAQKMFAILEDAAGVIAGIASENYVQAASSLISMVANIISKDNELEERIKQQERQVKLLTRAYNKLKDAMDNSWNTASLLEYRKEAIKTIEAQKRAYESMIRAEEAKKNSDSSRIEEYRQEIEDLDEQIKELTESMTEALGGFGSESNYKSAAQAFADAWVDAFNEGEDALNALNDTFENYFNNLIKKQALMRATQKYIQPVLDAIDQAVSEGSAGNNNGTDVTKEELEKIAQLKKENLEAYNKYMENFMKALGVEPTSSSNLSALQQGIQSVTETTAQALESLLNSMRFYVSTQTTDLAEIKIFLNKTLGNPNEDNGILKELRTQSSLMTSIRDALNGVITTTSKGKGIRVYN